MCGGVSSALTEATIIATAQAEAIEPYFSQDTAEDAEATHGFTAVAVNSFGTWLGSSHVVTYHDLWRH